jgi:hypothetical protein
MFFEERITILDHKAPNQHRDKPFGLLLKPFFSKNQLYKGAIWPFSGSSTEIYGVS